MREVSWPLMTMSTFFSSGPDAELRLLGHLEVAELLDLRDALLDRLHVDHVALVEGELPADDLVARLVFPWTSSRPR